MRAVALLEIKNELEETISHLSIESLKSKINTLRTQYRREVNAFEQSKKSGAGTNDIYKPKLWCFDNLSFINEGEMQRESRSNLDESTNQEVG